MRGPDPVLASLKIPRQKERVEHEILMGRRAWRMFEQAHSTQHAASQQAGLGISRWKCRGLSCLHGLACSVSDLPGDVLHRHQLSLVCHQPLLRTKQDFETLMRSLVLLCIHNDLELTLNTERCALPLHSPMRAMPLTATKLCAPHIQSQPAAAEQKQRQLRAWIHLHHWWAAIEDGERHNARRVVCVPVLLQLNLSTATLIVELG